MIDFNKKLEEIRKMKNIVSRLNKPIVFLDLETTGVDVLKDRIVELSATKIFPDGKTEKKCVRINPMIPIPPEATKIHGISNENVKNCGTFKQYSKAIFSFLQGCDVAGYNSNRFDFPLLAMEFERVSCLNPLENSQFIDVFNIVCELYPRNLKAIFKLYTGKELNEAHSAEADTDATIQVFDKMFEKHAYLLNDDLRISDIAKIGLKWKRADLAGKLIYNKEEKVCFGFGKHRNKPVSEVNMKDPFYIEWLLDKMEYLPNSTRKIIERECQI